MYYQRLLANKDKSPAALEIQTSEPKPEYEKAIKEPYMIEFLQINSHISTWGRCRSVSTTTAIEWDGERDEFVYEQTVEQVIERLSKKITYLFYDCCQTITFFKISI